MDDGLIGLQDGKHLLGAVLMELIRWYGRTRGDINQLLNGSRNLTLRTLAELADALGCKVELTLARGRGARAAPAARAVAGGRKGA